MMFVFDDAIIEMNDNVTTEEYMQLSSEVIEQIKKCRIVLYGAGAIGRALKGVLDSLSIPIEAYVDRKYEDIVKIGNVDVYGIDYLQECNDKDTLIIIAIDTTLFLEFQDEIFENLQKHCPKACVAKRGRELAILLRYGMCNGRLMSGEEFSLADCINCGGESKECPIFEQYIRSVSTKSKIDKSSFVLHKNKFFGCIMGNICSLRCKHCCEMVPYYRSKAYEMAEKLVASAKRIADATGFTYYIELIGGEPFMHPHIVYILEELLKIDDVGYIKIFTNGTIVPSDELCDLLKNRRIVLVWSNYEDVLNSNLLENVRKTRRKLEDKGVKYIYSMSKTWLDFSSFDYVEKTEEDLERDFEDCFIASCHRVYDGVLYRCPHQYAAVRLKKMNVFEGDCVDVLKEKSLETLSQKLKDFKDKKYVDACKYCVVPYKAEEVPAGQQLTAEEVMQLGK